tara:strand:- start:1035 stop:1181 length:147 start_codon:yes stop_codon:yes gene_type:complete
MKEDLKELYIKAFTAKELLMDGYEETTLDLLEEIKEEILELNSHITEL